MTTAVTWSKEQLDRGSMHGGNLADLPKPHHRRFDDPTLRRKVCVNIHQFTGIGVHWYVSLEEEYNPIWAPPGAGDEYNEKGRWQRCWDDTAGKGRYFDDRFAKLRGAIAFAVATAKKYFPESTHRLVYPSWVDEDATWTPEFPIEPS